MNSLLRLLLFCVVALAYPTWAESIWDSLKEQLSDEARLSLRGSDTFEKLTVRASSPRISPRFHAVVEVANAQDVVTTVRLAHGHSVPVLAVSGAHGVTTTLNRLGYDEEKEEEEEDGHSTGRAENDGGGSDTPIMINLRALNTAVLGPSGSAATLGGGILQHEAVSALSKHGKYAVTGICECVSVAGPLLGGGHSWLQGAWGFSADSLLAADVVLGNGTLVRVSAAEDEHPDLFWAIRGAGHNFGVVTSLDVKVRDVGGSWTMTVFEFGPASVGDVFESWNALEEGVEEPDNKLVVNGVFSRAGESHSGPPIITVQIIHEGLLLPNSAAAVYIERFDSLHPSAKNQVEEIDYANIYELAGFGRDSPTCRLDQNVVSFPNSHKRWDIGKMRAGFDLFAQATADHRFSSSIWLLESYGRRGVEAVDKASNAVPPEERENHILSAPILWWDGVEPEDRARAEELGRRMRDATGDDERPHYYVNYAFGPETAEQMYGYDKARLEKLRRLKAVWDPDNRFGFYNSLVSQGTPEKPQGSMAEERIEL